MIRKKYIRATQSLFYCFIIYKSKEKFLGNILVLSPQVAIFLACYLLSLMMKTRISS